MNLSNIKLGIYDFLGLAVPGMIAICEGWIALRGWHEFTTSLNHLSGISVTIMFLIAFVLGQLIQELADTSLKKLNGPRFSEKGRDDFWSGPECDPVKSAIWVESGIAMGSVDAAFDYCLTRLGDRFQKRDVLVGTSDLSRSLLVLMVFGLAATARLAWDAAQARLPFLGLLLLSWVLLFFLGLLAWKRMIRFRRMSEVGVFRAYLGSRPSTNREDDAEKPTRESLPL